MSTLLMACILFSFAGCCAVYMHKRFEEQLPMALGLVIVPLYLFALFDRLQIGAYTVLALAAAALAGQIVCLVKDRADRPWRYLLTPGFLAFSLIALWLLFSFQGYMYSEWDDFSHWGLAVKNMFFFTQLPSGVQEATISYTDYPPASTLFSWFWAKLSGAYNEGDAQRALNMMMMCFLLPAMREQEWKHPGKALAVSSILFILPLTMDPDAYRTLQVDTLLGCIVLYVLLAWFLSEHDKPVMLNICLSLMLLPLVKESGILFAAVSVLVMAADFLRHNSPKRKETLQMFLLLAVPVFIGYQSWQWYLQIHQVKDVWNESSFSMDALAKLLTGTGPSYWKTTIANFIEYLCTAEWWHDGHLFNLSHVMWIALLICVQAWTTEHCKDDGQRQRYRQAFGLLQTGLFLYYVAVLMIYLFVFREDEAVRLISLDRYLASYMLPFAGITLFAAGGVYESKKGCVYSRGPLYLLAALLMVVSPLMIAQNTVLAGSLNTSSYEKRMDELLPQTVVSKVNSQTDRVYVIACNDDGYQYYLNVYQFTPVRVQDGMWTTWPVVQKNAVSAERPAIEYSPSEWAQALLEGSFTHVYLDTIDQRFVTDYSSLFESTQAIAEAELYRVEKYGNGVKLRAVH